MKERKGKERKGKGKVEEQAMIVRQKSSAFTEEAEAEEETLSACYIKRQRFDTINRIMRRKIRRKGGDGNSLGQLPRLLLVGSSFVCLPCVDLPPRFSLVERKIFSCACLCVDLVED